MTGKRRTKGPQVIARLSPKDLATIYHAATIAHARGRRVSRADAQELADAVHFAEQEAMRLVADPDAHFDAVAFSRTCGSIIRAVRTLNIDQAALPPSARMDDCFLARVGIDDVLTYLRLIGREMDNGGTDDSGRPVLDPDSPFGPDDSHDAEMDADVAAAADAIEPRSRADDKRRRRRDDDDDDVLSAPKPKPYRRPLPVSES